MRSWISQSTFSHLSIDNLTHRVHDAVPGAAKATVSGIIAFPGW